MRSVKRRFRDFEGAVIDAESDHTVDGESVVELPEECEGKVVIGCVADNMRLPFVGEYFDAYVANLSLMLV